MTRERIYVGIAQEIQSLLPLTGSGEKRYTNVITAISSDIDGAIEANELAFKFRNPTVSQVKLRYSSTGLFSNEDEIHKFLQNSGLFLLCYMASSDDMKNDTFHVESIMSTHATPSDGRYLIVQFVKG